MPIRSRNNSPRLTSEAVRISMLADPTRGGRRDVLLGGRLEVLSWKGVPPADRLLIEVADATPASRIVATMTPSALPALVLRLLRPESRVAYHHIDLFKISSARNLIARHETGEIDLQCEPILPTAEDPAAAPDLILVSLKGDDETSLTLETLHQAHHRLAKGGKLLAAIDNPQDKWLARQIENVFGSLTRAARDKHAIVYLSKKHAAFAPPDSEALMHEHFIQRVEVEYRGEKVPFETCYGTFVSHKLDDGSGALLNEFQPLSPCPAVLDLGCGWGGLGILAARAAGASRLVMIDANARAVEMARRNSLRLGPLGSEVRLEANCESLLEAGAPDAGTFDLVVTNPPYGTEFRVTELFLRASQAALKPGGRLWVVAKNNPRLLERMRELFVNVQERRRWGYQVVTAVRQG